LGATCFSCCLYTHPCIHTNIYTYKRAYTMQQGLCSLSLSCVHSLSRSLTLFGLRVLSPTAPKSFPQSSTWMLISYFCCVVFFVKNSCVKSCLEKLCPFQNASPKKFGLLLFWYVVAGHIALMYSKSENNSVAPFGYW